MLPNRSDQRLNPSQEVDEDHRAFHPHIGHRLPRQQQDYLYQRLRVGDRCLALTLPGEFEVLTMCEDFGRFPAAAQEEE